MNLQRKQKRLKKKKTKAYIESQKSIVKLDDATGNLLGKMKAFVTNPIGAALIAITGAFKILSSAVGKSKGATENFNKIGAKLSGILNGIVAVIVPLVEWLGETLVKAFDNPTQAIKDFGDAILENVLNRFKSVMVLGDAFVLLFEGDIKGAMEKGKEAVLQFATGVEDVEAKITKFAEQATKDFDKTADATERLANAERSLIENNLALQKQQLISLKAAEDERAIRDDISVSIEDRIAANDRLGKVLDEQSQKELALAQQNLEFAKLRRIADGDNIDTLQEIGDAEIKLLEIRERIGGQRSEQLVNEQALIKEGADLQASINEQEFNQELVGIEAKKKRGEETLALELDLIERRKVALLDNATLTAQDIKLIEETAKAESAAVEEESRVFREEKRIAEVEQKLSESDVELETLRELEATKRDILLENDDLTKEERLEILRDFADRSAEIDNESQQKQSDNIKKTTQIIQGFANSAFEVSSALNERAFNDKNNLLNAERSRIESDGKAKIEGLEKGSRAEHEALVKLNNNLEENRKAREQLKKAEFESNKKSQSAQVVINGAAAIIKGFAQLGPVGGAIAAVSTVSATAASLIKINGATFESTSSPIAPPPPFVESKISSSVTRSSGGISNVGGSQFNTIDSSGSGVINSTSANSSSNLGNNTGVSSRATAEASNNVVGGASTSVVFSESKYDEFKTQVAFVEERTTV